MAKSTSKGLRSFDWVTSKISEAQKLVTDAHEALKQEAESLRKERTAFDEMTRTLNRVHFGKSVKLNVGGKIYKTSLDTLHKDPDSMLSSMFSGRFELRPDDEDGAFFIDRDGDIFRYVLNYLRNGELLGLTDSATKKELLAEARFYQLRGLIAELEEILTDSVVVVEEKHRKTLKSWLPSSTKCTLLFRATRDGYTPRDFHRCCDEKGPTLVVMKSGGYIFGGYASKSWQSATFLKTIVDDESFLFTLVNPSSTEPKKISTKPCSSGGLRCDSKAGPCFGTAEYYDLQVLCQNGPKTGVFSECRLDLGYGFQCPAGAHKKQFFTGTSCFNFDELEVFAVKTSR